MTRRSINVHAEKVPNPDAMKFTIEGILLTHGGYEYNSKEEAEESPLAAKLFGFDYVERVFISKNFVTVTKKAGMAGACIRCPFAPRTLKAGVEVILKRQFPEVVSVTSDTVNWEETEKEVSPGFD